MPPGPPFGPDDEEGATHVLLRRAECRIGKRLGSGGFAEIYAAEMDGPGAPRQVALKRLLPGMRGDPMRRRHLMREAQIAAQLRHRNIARALELVDLGDELAIVMELVEGISANHLLYRLAQRSERLSLGSISHVMEGLLAALSYLENPPLLGQRPLVHADISLENVMVTVAGEIKLVDFGIAGLDASVPPRDDDEGLTNIHLVAGKRAYAPPEGTALRPTVSSDLYAAGVCFWELLAGCRFPVLPRGVTNRELGSLIAFAADGLPDGVWTTLKLTLSLDPAVRPGSAERGRELMQAASVASSFSQEGLGQLVRSVLGQDPGPLPRHLPAASEPHDVITSLVERLHSAFCAHRVLAWEPVPPEEIEHMEGHEFILRAERGAAGGPLPDAVLREALDNGTAEEEGALLYRVRPPGGQPHVFVLQPGPGCVYDPLAQKVLRALLCPE